MMVVVLVVVLVSLCGCGRVEVDATLAGGRRLAGVFVLGLARESLGGELGGLQAWHRPLQREKFPPPPPTSTRTARPASQRVSTAPTPPRPRPTITTTTTPVHHPPDGTTPPPTSPLPTTPPRTSPPQPHPSTARKAQRHGLSIVRGTTNLNDLSTSLIYPH